MKGKIKCLSCSVIFILLFIGCMSFQCFAEDYGAIYPDYVNQSGGCFIECQTNLGKGSIVIPRNYQKNSIGFSGNGYNLMNINSSSLNGYFVLENGTTYTLSASGFSTFQYRSSSGSYYSWYDLTVFQIYNTNCFFVDDLGNRQNDRYDFENTDVILTICLVFLILIFFIMITNKQKGSNYQ